jgi:hypothetical protein
MVQMFHSLATLALLLAYLYSVSCRVQLDKLFAKEWVQSSLPERISKDDLHQRMPSQSQILSEREVKTLLKSCAISPERVPGRGEIAKAHAFCLSFRKLA